MFEKVNPAHPDKLADRIAGALVDLAYKAERAPKIAVEVLIGHGCCHIICETSTHLKKKDAARASVVPSTPEINPAPGATDISLEVTLGIPRKMSGGGAVAQNDLRFRRNGRT